MSTNIVTRKIQIVIDEQDPEKFKEQWIELLTWRRMAIKGANYITTHHFIQDNIAQLFYLSDNTKVKLANIEKDEMGILTTSRQNTTYQVLSKHFKREMPSGILTSLNSVVYQTYNKNKIDVANGVKSLSSYRNNLPIPFQFANAKIGPENEHGNYPIKIHGINFATRFGRDLSGNKIFFERAMAGEYQFADSGIYIEENKEVNGKTKKKIFLLCTFKFDKQQIKLKPGKEAFAQLSVDNPIIVTIGNNKKEIGNKEEFLHRRIAIQAALRRCQIAARYNKGGKGIKKKIAAIDRFNQKERNYIETRIHVYTRQLIDHCVKNACEKLILVNQKQKQTEAKEDEFVLRNWSYFGMLQKIQYKAKMYGIEVVVE